MTDNWLRRHYEDEAINLTTYFGGRIQIVRGRYASTIDCPVHEPAPTTLKGEDE